MQAKLTYTTINEYIATYPKDTQTKLKKLRSFIKDLMPKDVEETITYQMPTFKVGGRSVVYFAAFKNHIGFYPFPSGIAAFKDETKGFVTSKGTIQFPLDKPIPFDLVRKIVLFRLKETMDKIKAKKSNY